MPSVPVRQISGWTIGGGGKVRELFPLPPWMIVTGRLIAWLCRHPLVPGAVALVLWLGVGAGDWTSGPVLLVLSALAYGGHLVWRANRLAGGSVFRTSIPHVVKRWQIKLRWANACSAARMCSPLTGAPPKLKRLRMTSAGYKFRVPIGKVGHTADELESRLDTLIAYIGANSGEVSKHSPGLVDVELLWGDPTQRRQTLATVPDTPVADGALAFGLQTDGSPATALSYLSLLIVGASGSGKSNIVWALLAALIKRKIPFRLRVIDPAGGVELNYLQDGSITHEYTDRAKGAEDVIKHAHKAMYARLADMKKKGTRLHIPTKQEPLDITIIDEILLLKEQIKPDAPLGEILTIGRKASFVVWGLSQLSQIDVLGRIRDLFPQRLCLATKSAGMTDAILGVGAESQGAKCSKISPNTPGVGYSYIDGISGFRRFRSGHVADEHTSLIANGKLPEFAPAQAVTRFAKKFTKTDAAKLAKKQTAVYRLYSRDNRLLYTGITTSPTHRFAQHEEEKAWWSAVDMSKTVIVWYKNRALAKEEETRSIKNERPLYNVDEVEPDGVPR